MNLLDDPWIPVRRASGNNARIAPWQLTESADPVVALAAPRPDFNGALMQFLVGLLQTACPPDDGDQWADLLESPPSPDRLRDRLERHLHAFELDKGEIRFMQDFDQIAGDPKPIEALLIDTPGAQAIRHNTDHFVKRQRASSLCFGCTATALLTLQTNAPAGGKGQRTSLRGGGPLTTLVMLDPLRSGLPDTLWNKCWLNVLPRPSIDRLGPSADGFGTGAIFPWLDHTRTSEANSGSETTPLDVHPLQMYWGMPRRIRIHWEDAASGECDLCGEHSDRLVKHYTTKNYGTDYTGAWRHPLSPYQQNKNGEYLAQHPQPGGLSYRHWLDLTLGTDGRESALVVKRFMDVKLQEEQLRLHAFGYDMDNMKARCWYETTFPLYTIPPSVAEILAKRVETLIETAHQTASLTRKSIKDAWFKRPGDAKGDTGYLTEAFFQHTEGTFFGLLDVLIRDLEAGGNGKSMLGDWHPVLAQAGMAVFDHWTSSGDGSVDNLRRIAIARTKLRRQLHCRKFKATLFPDDQEGEAA